MIFRIASIAGASVIEAEDAAKQKRLARMRSLFSGAALAITLLVASPASATPISQYASSVLGFSSQYSPGGFSAAQALFEPNTPEYRDAGTAWAPERSNGSMEYLLVGFETAVNASGVNVWETWGNGFVTQIDVLDVNDVLHTVWAGADPGLPGAPYKFSATWETTDFLVKGVKIHVDTNHNIGTWEEIDAVQLLGESVASEVPEPTMFSLLGIGLAGLAVLRRHSNENA